MRRNFISIPRARFVLSVSCALMLWVVTFTLSSGVRCNNTIGISFESNEDTLESRTHQYASKVPKYVCSHGEAPWHTLDLKLELETFYHFYASRPGGDNIGGGAFFHYFAIWCTVRALKPETIIESGIHNGVGSWLIRQAAENSRMILISPEDPQVYRDDHNDTEYFTAKAFTDFASIDWQSVMPSFASRARTLILFDDHQAGTVRLRQARQLGFGHVMFDDNYISGYGDNLSVKMICEPATQHLILGYNKSFLMLDNFGRTKHEVSAEWYLSKRTEFLEDIEIYAEFPPTWDGPSRFDIAANIWSQITLPALFATEEVAHFDVDFEQESMRYTHIVYLKVKNGVVSSD